jgi:hypothetical protein
VILEYQRLRFSQSSVLDRTKQPAPVWRGNSEVQVGLVPAPSVVDWPRGSPRGSLERPVPHSERRAFRKRSALNRQQRPGRGHLADGQYMFCSIVLGEKNPAPKIEQTKTSKADLIAALKNAFAYCDKAYDGMTDASAAEMVKLFGNDTPKLGVLSVNSMHNLEHYGKNIVPPTSEPGFQPQPKK